MSAAPHEESSAVLSGADDEPSRADGPEPSSISVGALGLLGSINPIVLVIDEIDDALRDLDQEVRRALHVNNVDIHALQLIDRRRRRGVPTRVRDLTARLGTTSGTSTEIAKRLERAGLILSEPDSTDRRGRTLVITTRAEEMLQNLLGPVRTELADLLDSLAPDDEARLLEILQRTRDILQRPSE